MSEVCWIAALCTSASGIHVPHWQKQSSKEEAAPQLWRQRLWSKSWADGGCWQLHCCCCGFFPFPSESDWWSLRLGYKTKIPFSLMNGRIPCPGKIKQINNITVLPIVQALWWGFGRLEGDASAIAPPWSGQCPMQGSPSKQGERSPDSQGCLVWWASSHTLWQCWEPSILPNPDSPHWLSLW